VAVLRQTQRSRLGVEVGDVQSDDFSDSRPGHGEQPDQGPIDARLKGARNTREQALTSASISRSV
jgi:hypothetical protein